MIHEFARLFLDIGPVESELTGKTDDVYAWDAVVFYLSNRFDELKLKEKTGATPRVGWRAWAEEQLKKHNPFPRFHYRS